MTNELTVPAAADLAAMSTEDLRAELSRAIGITAKSIATVAAIWTELERRGADLSGVRFALRNFMRGVGEGRILPELVANLAGSVRTLSLAADLAVADQRRLVDGAHVDVVTLFGVVPKTISEMTWAEAARVIRSGHILTAEEQKIAMQRASAAQRKPRPGRPCRVIIDRVTSEVRIGVQRAPVEKVIAELRAAGYI